MAAGLGEAWGGGGGGEPTTAGLVVGTAVAAGAGAGATAGASDGTAAMEAHCVALEGSTMTTAAHNV